MKLETHTRSVFKAVTWRATATLTTVILVYIFTGQTETAITVGGLELVLKMFLYYLHERGWNHISFGVREATPSVLWFTGLSGSGKSTVAHEVYKRLKKMGLKVEYFDGDQIRALFPSTGFTREAREDHIRRVGHLAATLERTGTFVVASLISPYKDSRDFVRSLCKNFMEVYVSTPLEVCEKRDTKGYYKKARAGELKNFTGIDSQYEAPTNPEVEIDTSKLSVEEGADQVLKYAKKIALSKW